MVGFFSKGDCVSHVLLILPLWFIFYNLGSSLGYEAMKNGVDTCFNTCILRLPPCHLLNLPGLRYVSYLQEKYFHFSSTFSFALMSSEMYSLVQFTCGIIVCWELCLLRHNTLPNRHTTSWLFMTNSFKKPKTSISRDFSKLPCIFCPDSLMAITSKTIYIYKTEENLKTYTHTHTHTHTYMCIYACICTCDWITLLYTWN